VYIAEKMVPLGRFGSVQKGGGACKKVHRGAPFRTAEKKEVAHGKNLQEIPQGGGRKGGGQYHVKKEASGGRFCKRPLVQNFLRKN